MSSPESSDSEYEGPMEGHTLSELYPAMRASWLAELAETEEFKILSKLSQATTIVADVVQEIKSLTLAAVSNKDPFYLHYRSMTESLLEIVQKTLPTQQSPFVEFLAQLKEVVVLDPMTGKTFTYSPYGDEDQDIWRDLPGFVLSARESRGMNISDRWDPGLSSSEQQMIESANAFFAQLDAAGICPFPLFALYACRDAFETASPILMHDGEEVSRTCVVRTACQYFIYMADKMWAYVEEGLSFDGFFSETMGFRGFDHERWAVWEQKLKVERDSCGSDVGTKQLIEDALAQIARVTTKNDS